MQNQKAVNSEGEVGITEDELSPCVQEKKKKNASKFVTSNRSTSLQ